MLPIAKISVFWKNRWVWIIIFRERRDMQLAYLGKRPDSLHRTYKRVFSLFCLDKGLKILKY